MSSELPVTVIKDDQLLPGTQVMGPARHVMLAHKAVYINLLLGRLASPPGRPRPFLHLPGNLQSVLFLSRC